MENPIKEHLTKLDELQKKSSGLKAYIKDQLLNDPEYHKITEELVALNLKRKKIIAAINNDNQKEIEEIENLSVTIKQTKALISDLTLSEIVKGHDSKVTDKSGMILAPVVSIKFKKTGDYEKPAQSN